MTGIRLLKQKHRKEVTGHTAEYSQDSASMTVQVRTCHDSSPLCALYIPSILTWQTRQWSSSVSYLCLRTGIFDIFWKKYLQVNVETERNEKFFLSRSWNAVVTSLFLLRCLYVPISGRILQSVIINQVIFFLLPQREIYSCTHLFFLSPQIWCLEECWYLNLLNKKESHGS